ncbi:MAG: hypothetical protein AABY01_04405 [Nanoarchaeota archaeon]
MEMWGIGNRVVKFAENVLESSDLESHVVIVRRPKLMGAYGIMLEYGNIVDFIRSECYTTIASVTDEMKHVQRYLREFYGFESQVTHEVSTRRE